MKSLFFNLSTSPNISNLLITAGSMYVLVQFQRFPPTGLNVRMNILNARGVKFKSNNIQKHLDCFVEIHLEIV